MGHDVYAYRVSDAEREKLHAAFEAEVKGADRDGWLAAYDRYCKATQVAYLRRSAFDRRNSTIYAALEVPQFDGGCSGTGDGRVFTRAEVVRALGKLDRHEPPASVAPNLAHQVLGALAATGNEVLAGPGDDEDEGDMPERTFLRRIVAWMDSEKRDSVEVYFG